jgi:hypothetical protein
VLVPYSTYHVVAVPFGLTLPETVADVGPTLVTGPVAAVGAVAAAAEAAASSATVATAIPVASSFAMPCGDNSNRGRHASGEHAILPSAYNALACPANNRAPAGVGPACEAGRRDDSTSLRLRKVSPSSYRPLVVRELDVVASGCDPRFH